MKTEMESLISYASLLVEKSDMTNHQATEQRKIDSRKKIDPLRNAQEICMRYVARGNVFPCRWVDRQNDPLKEQEFKDALKLTRWKLALKGNRTGYGVCSDEVRDFLDKEMRGWRDDVMKRSASLKHAQDITRRYVIRGQTLPRPLHDKNCTDSILLQEHKDYLKLLMWYKSLNGTGRKCPGYIFQYLDKEIPQWKDVAEFRKKPLSRVSDSKSYSTKSDAKSDASSVSNWNGSLNGSGDDDGDQDVDDEHCIRVLAQCPTDDSVSSNIINNVTNSEQMNSFLQRESAIYDGGTNHTAGGPRDRNTKKRNREDVNSRNSQDSANTTNSSELSSSEAPGHEQFNGSDNSPHGSEKSAQKFAPKPSNASQAGRNKKRSKQDPLEYARNIVNRYKVRGNVLPCRWLDRQNDPVREQEFKDALKLTRWKLALKGNRTGYGVCSDAVRDFLDQEMPGWRQERHASTS